MQLGRVLVLGLGKSGRATVQYCLPLLGNRVSSLCVAAGERTQESIEFAAEVSAYGVQLAFGDGGVQELVGSLADGESGSEPGTTPFDICIPSPGIPPTSPLYVAALEQSLEVVSEVEFAWRESAVQSRWVAVTGTNGKTTTCALCAHLLQSAGLAATAVGNIGDACIQAVAAGKTDIYVAEVSSYQLASTHDFAPDVSIFLNITPDHLHWHGSFEAYCEAKFKLFDHLSSVPNAVAILNATDDVVRRKLRELRTLTDEERGFALIPLGTKEGIHGDMRTCCNSPAAAFLAADGTLHVAFNGVEQVLVSADELLIKGEHNVVDALGAAAAALVLGAKGQDVAAGLKTFTPLEHRIEPCGEVDGVRFYNDSKATNVDATLQALAAFSHTPLIVLLGGDDKGTDLTPLVDAARNCARVVVCYGDAGPRFFEAFSNVQPAGDTPVLLSAQHLADAFDVACEAAQTGEVVLLSPACASFDEFDSFEQRGQVFKALVAAREECEA